MTRSRQTAIEVLWALIVLVIVTSVYASQVGLLGKARREFVREQRCIGALDNVVEALAADTRPVTVDRASQLLAAEWELTVTPDHSAVVPRCRRDGPGLVLGYYSARGRPLAEVRIAP